MGVLKQIFFLFFLCSFINARTNNYVVALQNKVADTKKAHQLTTLKIFAGNSENNDHTYKRKRKPRGVEVSILVISVLTFDLACLFTEFISDPITNPNASFLYCVSSKRGPPLS